MKKITKFSLSLASLALLGGGVVTNVVPVLDKNIVHAEDTAQQAISVLIGAVSAEDGSLSHYFVTINLGETKTVSAPEVAGYKLDEYTEPTYTLTYDYALRMYKEGGGAWILFWMVKDSPSPEPTNPEQPVQQPKTLKVAWISIDGDLSNTTLKEEVITVNPGESHTVSALDFPGYRLTDGSKAGTYTYETMEKEAHIGIWYTRDHSTPTPEPTPDPTVTEEPTTEAPTTTAPTPTTEAPQTETSSTESSATSSSSSASTTSGEADSTSTASTTARTEVTEAKTEAPTTQKEEKKTLPKQVKKHKRSLA